MAVATLREARARRRQAITASGMPVDSKVDGEMMRRLNQPWQLRSFTYYNLIPEVWYAGGFYSRHMSRIELQVQELNDDGDWARIEDAAAPEVEFLDRIQDERGGRTVMLGAYGRLRFLVGECYLVSFDPNTDDEKWEILSKREFRPRQDGKGYERIRFEGAQPEQISEAGDMDAPTWEQVPESAWVWRLWRRHPEFSLQADSPMRAVQDILEELLLLTLAVRAGARSRIARSGLLLIPNEMDLPAVTTGLNNDPLQDPFLRTLVEHMEAPLKDEGSAASVVPLFIRGPLAALAGLRQLVLQTEGNYPEKELRTECVQRFANGVDMPPEVLLGTGDVNHWGCVDAETEILTRGRGWVTHEQVDAGDVVLTLNHETGESEWQPLIAMNRYAVTDAPMLRLSGRAHSSLTTLNHRWPTLHAIEQFAHDGRGTRLGQKRERHWTTSADLNTADQIIRAAPHADSDDVGWTDAMVELVAWTWTEGSIEMRTGRLAPRVRIYQSHRVNPENVERIRSCLTRLYGPGHGVLGRGGRGGEQVTEPRWREQRRANGMTMFTLNAAAARQIVQHCPDRVVTHCFLDTLTQEQLRLFIETSVRADGHVMATSTMLVMQQSRERLEALEYAAILLGMTTNLTWRPHPHGYGGPLWELTIGTQTHPRVTKRLMSHEAYTGTIWCPTTPNGSWLARRDGKPFYTGNSWQISQQSWEAHIQPVVEEFCEELSATVFRPSLEQSGTPAATARRRRIWYDPVKIVNHPDRGKDAQDVFDRGELGGAALRVAKGFDEDDAPTETERARWIGVRVRDSGLAWYGKPTLKAGATSETGQPLPGDTGTGGEDDTGGEVPPDQGGTGNDVATGPPADANDQAARLLGAAESALLQCRKTAGSRIIQRLPRSERAKYARVPKHQLYARISAEDMARYLAAANGDGSPLGLVRGGTEAFEECLRAWGYPPERVQALSEYVEEHAARTLADPEPVTFAPIIFNL